MSEPTREDVEAYLARLRIPPPCPRCRGSGFTWWASFVAGLANLIGWWAGSVHEPTPCRTCRGRGRTKDGCHE